MLTRTCAVRGARSALRASRTFAARAESTPQHATEAPSGALSERPPAALFGGLLARQHSGLPHRALLLRALRMPSKKRALRQRAPNKRMAQWRATCEAARDAHAPHSEARVAALAGAVVGARDAGVSVSGAAGAVAHAAAAASASGVERSSAAAALHAAAHALHAAGAHDDACTARSWLVWLHAHTHDANSAVSEARLVACSESAPREPLPSHSALLRRAALHTLLRVLPAYQLSSSARSGALVGALVPSRGAAQRVSLLRAALRARSPLDAPNARTVCAVYECLAALADASSAERVLEALSDVQSGCSAAAAAVAEGGEQGALFGAATWLVCGSGAASVDVCGVRVARVAASGDAINALLERARSARDVHFAESAAHALRVRWSPQLRASAAVAHARAGELDALVGALHSDAAASALGADGWQRVLRAARAPELVVNTWFAMQRAWYAPSQRSCARLLYAVAAARRARAAASNARSSSARDAAAAGIAYDVHAAWRAVRGAGVEPSARLTRTYAAHCARERSSAALVALARELARAWPRAAASASAHSTRAAAHFLAPFVRAFAAHGRADVALCAWLLLCARASDKNGASVEQCDAARALAAVALPDAAHARALLRNAELFASRHSTASAVDNVSSSSSSSGSSGSSSGSSSSDGVDGAAAVAAGSGRASLTAAVVRKQVRGFAHFVRARLAHDAHARSDAESADLEAALSALEARAQHEDVARRLDARAAPPLLTQIARASGAQQK